MLNKKTKILAILFVLATSSLLAQTAFTKITTGAIVTDEMDSQSCSWVDYDNDGDLDLFVTNETTNNALYQNNGDDSFTRITSGVIVSDFGGSATWGDYDNDGDLDLFVARPISRNSLLYKNNGDGSFTRIAAGTIVNEAGESRGSSWGDYDNDGDLDLFVANGLGGGGVLTLNFLYQSQGDPDGTGQVTFVRIRDGALVNDLSSAGSCNWADYDNDGDLDLFFVAADHNFLYRNSGFGSLARTLMGVIVKDDATSQGSSWGDYDNDGDLDLFVANFGNNFLYENNGDGSFTRITSGEIVNDAGSSMGSSWGDYDNDGDLDLFVANFNHFPEDAEDERNFLYQNNGEGSFTRITSGTIVNDGGESFGCSWGDYDNDGDLDLFVANRSGVNLLYRNDGNSHNWINIECIGSLSNRAAIGAKVRVQATLNGEQVWQLREISAQTGADGQNSLNAEFGLRDAARIDSVTIEWPSGTAQVLTDLQINQFLTIKEILPPRIDHTPISTIESETAITIEATVSAADLAETDLFYRQGGDTTFATVLMSDQGNGSFQGTIPAGAVTSKGLEYHIIARDIGGNTGQRPPEGNFSVRVHVSAGIARDQEEPHGSSQTAYHIFSVPLDLDDKTPAAIFEDDMGEYDDTRWRFLEVTGDNTTLEFPDITEIVPGKGYWFLVTEPARFIDTGGGTSNITSEEYTVILRPGWNLIGNPFDFPIPVENVLLLGMAADLRTFSGSWNNPVTAPVPGILPFEGYAVFNENAFNDTLFMSPDISAPGLSKKSQQSSSKASPQKMAEQVIAENARRDAVAPGFLSNHWEADAARTDDILWSINIMARCQQARDVDNLAGVSLLASKQWDRLDFPEPPPIGEYVSVYFTHRDWGTRSKRFCTDFRPAFSQGSFWEFEVKSNIRDRVRLTFGGLESMPRDFEVWLVDESLNLTQNLRDDPQFFVAGSEEHPKRLKLLVGKSEFIGESLANVQTIPSDFELAQNFPNPFNPATTIRYGLPRDESVTLKIYNILGKEVVTLLNNERKAAGNHLAIWDGRNSHGQVVASGIYVYRLRGGEFSKIRKMVFLR